jgi:hypothetical protein
MSTGKPSPTDSAAVRNPRTPNAKDIIDFGAAPLQLPTSPDHAVEVTAFIDDDSGPDESIILVPDATAITEFVESAPRRWLITRAFLAVCRFTFWLFRSLFGIASLILLLAVIAAIPIVNFLALGYLLEVEGSLARTGRLRDAFPLLQQAPRLGAIALGLWVWQLPLRALSNLAADARLIDPGSFADVSLHIVLFVLAIVVAAHLCLALAHGGSLWAFFWPPLLPIGIGVAGILLIATAPIVLAALLIALLVVFAIYRGRTLEWLNQLIRGWGRALLRGVQNYRAFLKRLPTPDYWTEASTEIRKFVVSLRLKHHFLLGLKGFGGALIWLFIPTLIFGAARKTEGGPVLITLFGGILLMLVLSWVPFLQAHFAAENRFGAMFELRKVRQLFKNAPFSWLITMLVTLTLALPMYLFKIRLPPTDAMWMETIVFIVTIYPVKVITGWAYHRAVARERRAFFGFRWLTRLVMLPLLAIYVFLLFFTQFIGENGKLVLFQHHAFMLPAPF